MDLEQVAVLHPDLPEDLARALVMYASVALERQHHAPGVGFAVVVRGQSKEEVLVWRERLPSEAPMLDMNRVTEDGAECLALLVAGTHCRWRALRRLQWRLGEGADWLVEELPSGAEIVLEVSGTDAGPFERRIRQKKAQAIAANPGGRVAACVVRFLEPKATLWSD
jgi:hypothetical protein